MYHKKNRPPQEHRPRGKECRCCCPRSRQGAWTRGASAFSRFKNHQTAWFFHLISWSCRWRCDSASERNWIPRIADPFNTVMAQFNRNVMLEFSKTLDTTWHDHLLGCTGVLLSIHQSFPMLKSPFYLAFWIWILSLKSLAVRKAYMWVMFFMALLSWLFF